MNDFLNSNYVTFNNKSNVIRRMFVGIIHVGGKSHTRSRYIVRIPVNAPSKSTAIGQCKTKRLAEELFLKHVPNHVGSIPYLDQM